MTLKLRIAPMETTYDYMVTDREPSIDALKRLQKDVIRHMKNAKHVHEGSLKEYISVDFSRLLLKA